MHPKTHPRIAGAQRPIVDRFLEELNHNEAHRETQKNSQASATRI